MRLDQETLVAIVEEMASGTASLADAARNQDVPLRTFWRWMQRSRNGEDEMLIHWPDEEPIQFIRALSMARKMAALEARSRFEKKNVLGYYEKETRFQGAPVWAEDPSCVGMDPDLRELLGYSRDGLLRDENGCCIPVVERIETPAALQLRYLASMFPELREHSVTDQNVSLHGSLGVTHMKSSFTRESGPPAIAPPPPRPLLPVEEIVAEPDEDAAPLKPSSDVQGTDPVTDETFETQPPTPAPELDRVIREPAPTEYTPTASERKGRSLSALEQDLLTRLRGDPLRRSASPVGSTISLLPKILRPA